MYPKLIYKVTIDFILQYSDRLFIAFTETEFTAYKCKTNPDILYIVNN
ncbi:MAG: hypothetical protein M1391_14615 [Bacteroidetes bacterium]|nr:hypothetical protein [Bacteroidota bacterium]MCL6099796.1 hypothetical protein [Bacteroidota bacterium]